MSSNRLSIWKRSSNQLRQNEVWLEYFCLAGLLVAALILFLVNLSSLPLLDPVEGTLAQVAKEIYRGQSSWIFPQLWDEPYWQNPPLVYNLVAIAYKIAGVNEWTTRFPGAFLGAMSVLLLYQIGREIFVARIPALFSALVYLTSIPVVRYSRLATGDGALLCFELLMVFAVLRSRRDLRWSFAVGGSFSLIALTDGLFSLQMLAIVLLFLFWDTPRLLNSRYFWLGLALGAIPSVSWYGLQWFEYHKSLTGWNLWDLLATSAQTATIGNLSSGSYWLQGLQYVLPWLAIVFVGLQSIERHLHWGWGKLLVVWLGGYFVLAFMLLDREYWAILPLYPALSLTAGKQLDRICNLPSNVAYPQFWLYGFSLMSAVTAVAGLNWGIRNYVDFYLPFICGSLAITFGATALVIAQQDKQFIPLLFWGLFVSIFLLVVSPHWIWELDTEKSLEPIADLVKEYTPKREIVYSSFDRGLSSLNFYSDRQIVFQSVAELKQHWQNESSVYLLIDTDTSQQLKIAAPKIVRDRRLKSLNWVFAVKNEESILTDRSLMPGR